MAEKKAEFVVTDRRRFGTEGEPRPDAQVVEEEKPAPSRQQPRPRLHRRNNLHRRNRSTQPKRADPSPAKPGTAGIAQKLKRRWRRLQRQKSSTSKARLTKSPARRLTT